MPYGDMRNFLKIAFEKPNTKVKCNMLNMEDKIKVYSPKNFAGLQFVDAIASSFYNAVRYVNSNNGYVHANKLKPTVYNRKGIYEGFGILFFPEELKILDSFAWLLTEYKA